MHSWTWKPDLAETGLKAFELVLEALGQAVPEGGKVLGDERELSLPAFRVDRQKLLHGLGRGVEAFEIQSAYLKGAYEGFVAYASKVGELYTSLAKETVKPYETLFAKATAIAK